MFNVLASFAEFDQSPWPLEHPSHHLSMTGVQDPLQANDSNHHTNLRQQVEGYQIDIDPKWWIWRFQDLVMGPKAPRFSSSDGCSHGNQPSVGKLDIFPHGSTHPGQSDGEGSGTGAPGEIALWDGRTRGKGDWEDWDEWWSYHERDYPLVICYTANWKDPPCFMGKSTINGHFP